MVLQIPINAAKASRYAVLGDFSTTRWTHGQYCTASQNKCALRLGSQVLLNAHCCQHINLRSFSSKLGSSRPTPSQRTFGRVLRDTLFGGVELVPQIPRAWKVFRYGPASPPPSLSKKRASKSLQLHKSSQTLTKRTLPTGPQPYWLVVGVAGFVISASLPYIVIKMAMLLGFT